jgi:hypothetical protein
MACQGKNRISITGGKDRQRLSLFWIEKQIKKQKALKFSIF